MDKKTAHLLVQAVQVSLNQSVGDVDPKRVFCEFLVDSVTELNKQGQLTTAEKNQVINAKDRIFDAAVRQMNDPSPNTALKIQRTSLQMFGPQFIMPPELMQQIVTEMGHTPLWAVVSTFGADTLYSGLTYTEAMHRAQIEALEVGREAVVVLVLNHFQGESLFG